MDRDVDHARHFGRELREKTMREAGFQRPKTSLLAERTDFAVRGPG
jgi:hypothetical protein